MPLFQIWSVLVLIILAWFMYSVRSKTATGQISMDRLTQGENIITWLLCLANPIISGLVLYYGWKNRLPIKAKQANRITFMAFIPWIAYIGYTLFYLPSITQ